MFSKTEVGNKAVRTYSGFCFESDYKQSQFQVMIFNDLFHWGEKKNYCKNMYEGTSKRFLEGSGIMA